MIYTEECDPVPVDEPCVSVCADIYFGAMHVESRIFCRQMHRVMDKYGQFKIELTNNLHDFGPYLSAKVCLSTDEMLDAFNNEFPEHWDDIAINELLNSDVVVAYYEKYNPEHLQSLRNRQRSNKE